MKRITKISVTKLVLLLLVISLIVIELYKVFKGSELDQIFVDTVLMVISFYFGQKGIKYENVDSIMEDEENKE